MPRNVRPIPSPSGWGSVGWPLGLIKVESVAIADGMMNVTVRKLAEPVTVKGNNFLFQGAIVRSLHPGHVGWYYEAKT